jgi:hypothetical protein
MSHLGQTIYEETIHEIIEENQERKEHFERRTKEKPFNAIPLNENFVFDRGAKMIYGSIINLKK